MYKFLKVILKIFLIGFGLLFALILIIALTKEYNKPSKAEEAEFINQCQSTIMLIETIGFTENELNSTNKINLILFKDNKSIDNYSISEESYEHSIDGTVLENEKYMMDDNIYTAISNVTKSANYIVVEQKNGQKYTLSDFKYKVGYNEDLLDYFPENCIIDTCKIDGKLAKRCVVQFMK
jgi:hypothetical protein